MTAARARQQQQQGGVPGNKENVLPAAVNKQLTARTQSGSGAGAAAARARSASQTPSSVGQHTISSSNGSTAPTGFGSSGSATPLSRPSTSSSAAVCAAQSATAGPAAPTTGDLNMAPDQANDDPTPTSLSQCRICRKYISLSEQCHLCSNCNQFICEDCASYSASDQHWMCSSCRRRATNTLIAVDAIKELGLHKDSSPVRRMTIRLNQNELKITAGKLQSLAGSSTAASSGTAADTGSNWQQPQQQQPQPQQQHPPDHPTQRPMSGTSTSTSSASGTSGSGSGSGGAAWRPSAQSTAAQQQQPPTQRAPAASMIGKPSGTGAAPTTEVSPKRSAMTSGTARRLSAVVSAASAAVEEQRASQRQSFRAAGSWDTKDKVQPTSSASMAQQRGANEPPQALADLALPMTMNLSGQHPPVRRASVASPTDFGPLNNRQSFAPAGPTTMGPLISNDQRQWTAGSRKQSIQQQQSFGYGLPTTRTSSRRGSMAIAAAQYAGLSGGYAPPPQTLITASSDASIDNPSNQGSRRESLSWNPLQSLPLVDRSMMRHSDGHLDAGAANAASNKNYNNAVAAAAAAASSATNLVPMLPEQIHLRRLSDQSNLVRRSSIIANTLDGGAIARNRSHSNIDSATMSTGYFEQTAMLQQQQQQLLQHHHHQQMQQQYFGRSDESLHHLPVTSRAINQHQQRSAPSGYTLGIDHAAVARQRRASDQLDRHQLAKQQQQYEYLQQQQQRKMSQMSALITSASQKRRRSSEEIRSDSSSDLDEQTAALGSLSKSGPSIQQQPVPIPSVSVSEFSSNQGRQRQQRSRQQQQSQQQPPQDHIMTTPMEINVAIEQAIQMQQQQQQQDQYSLAANSYPVRRGSSGRVLPKVPGEQQSRSLLDLPQQQQQQQQQQMQQQQVPYNQQQQQFAGTGGIGMMLDLPCPSPSVRRASAPEGQNIKIVVNDIDGLMMHHRGSGTVNLMSSSSTRLVGGQQLPAGRDAYGGTGYYHGFQNGPGYYQGGPSGQVGTGGASGPTGSSEFYERVVLYRDEALELETDPSMPLANGNCGGRGFGLHVMGGKISTSSQNGITGITNGFSGMMPGNKPLQAYTTWVKPDGPADKAGLKPGDQIIEWDGKCLIDMSYEQVAEVIESSANVAELLVKPATRPSGGKFYDSLNRPRRMSQQIDRDNGAGARFQQSHQNHFQHQDSLNATEQFPANRQRRSSGQQQVDSELAYSASRAGTGRKLPQIPPITATDTAKGTTVLGYDIGPPGQAAIRHASTGQIEIKGTGSSYGDVSGAYFAPSNLLMAAQEQQSRSASELHGKGASARAYAGAGMQTMTPLRTRTNSTNYDNGNQWLAQQQVQHLAGQHNMMQPQVQPQMLFEQSSLGYQPQHQQQLSGYLSGSRQSYKDTFAPSPNYESRGLIGLEVNVDEHKAALEITVLTAINVDRDTSLDYCCRVRVLPECSQFKPCLTQPSSDLKWDETFLLQNFPVHQVHKMALEIGIWRSSDVLGTTRLSTQIAQPICETLIPIQTARARHTNYWPLGPPPTSPQSRRKSLNDLIEQQYMDNRANHLGQVSSLVPNLQHYWPIDAAAGRIQAGDMPRSHQHLFSTSANSVSASLPRRPSVSHDSPKGSRVSPIGLAHAGRERSASNRNLPDTSKFLQTQPRRASDEVASGSSHRLITRISPAASRRSISVMNVGVGSSSIRAARTDSQTNLLSRAQLVRRDSLQQQQQPQQQSQRNLGSSGSPASKYSSPVASVSREHSSTATGVLPSGRRSSLVGIQSMIGYRSQKNSQSDTAPETDSPSRRGSRGPYQQSVGATYCPTAAATAVQQQSTYGVSTDPPPGSRQTRQSQSQPQSQPQQQSQPSPQQHTQSQASSGGERTISQPVSASIVRAGASDSGSTRRSSIDQSGQAQQPHPPALQRKGSFALQTLRKLKRTMSLTKGNDSNPSSQQESRRSSSSSNYSTEVPEDLGVARPSSSHSTHVGKIKLVLFLSKGQFEIEVISAQGLKLDTDSAQGVYVKTYLRGLSKSNKRKTRTVQPWESPIFKQTIKYDGSLIDSNKSLEVSIWVKQNGLRGKQPIGFTEIRLNTLDLARPQTSWYNLRSMEGLCSSSIED